MSYPSFVRHLNWTSTDVDASAHTTFGGTWNSYDTLYLDGDAVNTPAYVQKTIGFRVRDRLFLRAYVYPTNPVQDDVLALKVLDSTNTMVAQIGCTFGSQAGANATVAVKLSTHLDATGSTYTLRNKETTQGVFMIELQLDARTGEAYFLAGHPYGGALLGGDWGSIHTRRNTTPIYFSAAPHAWRIDYAYQAGSTCDCAVYGLAVHYNPWVAIGDSNCCSLFDWGLGQAVYNTNGSGHTTMPILCHGQGTMTLAMPLTDEVLSTGDRWSSYSVDQGFDRVLLGPIGINDIIFTSPTIAQLQTAWDTVFDGLLGSDLKQLVVLTLCPYYEDGIALPVTGALSVAQSRLVDQLNEHIRSRAAGTCDLIDTHALLRDSDTKTFAGGDSYWKWKSGLTADGLHAASLTGGWAGSAAVTGEMGRILQSRTMLPRSLPVSVVGGKPGRALAGPLPRTFPGKGKEGFKGRKRS